MTSVRFHCVGCGTEIDLAAGYAGQVGRCPLCSAGFIVPFTEHVTSGQPDSTLESFAPAFPEQPASCECGTAFDPASGLCQRCALEAAATSAIQMSRFARRRRRPARSESQIAVISAVAVMIIILIIVAIAATQGDHSTLIVASPHPSPGDERQVTPDPNPPLVGTDDGSHESSQPVLGDSPPRHRLFDSSNVIMQNTSAAGDEGRPPEVVKPPAAQLPPAPATPVRLQQKEDKPRAKPQHPSPVDFLKDRARRLLEEGDVFGAIDKLEEIQKLDPEDEKNLIITAALYLEKNRAMRAAQILKTWLATRPNHEMAQNALGAALERVDDWNQAYWSMQQIYVQYDAALARARADGAKRWGAEWVEAGVADQNWQQLTSAQIQFKRSSAQLDKLKPQLAQLIQQRKDALSRLHNWQYGHVDIAGFDSAIHGAESELADARRRIDDARRTIQHMGPHFPEPNDHVQ